MEMQEDDFHSNVDHLKSVIYDAQKEVKSNPCNYDGHVKLISSLSDLHSVYKSLEQEAADVSNAREKTLVAFNKLRNARKNMATVFPLSVDLWVEWINDELDASITSENYDVIEEIFEKATVDYLSVKIWCLYMKFLVSRKDCPSRITKAFIREKFEEAVTNCGLHYVDGHDIWELYQEFELQILLETEKKLREDSTPENIENYKAQSTNLIKLFKRQMRVPLANHSALLKNFSDKAEPWLKTLNSFIPEIQLFKMEEFKSIHEGTAEEILSKSIVTLEKNLEECQHSLESYQSYICHELDSDKSDPSRVRCLFERAIVHHCLKSSIWLDYIDFLSDVLKQLDLALSTSKRALRNVTWDSRIYLKYVVLLEQTTNDPDIVRNAYEMGLDKYCDNGINYCYVLMSFLSFEKKMCDGKVAIIKKKPHIYELIQKAVHHFEGLPDSEKFVIEFMIFWINIESFWFDDKAKGEIILKYFAVKYRKDFSVWYQVITFARAFGLKSLVNELLDVHLQECPDSFEQFGQSCLNFENIFGTLSSYNHLQKKINLHIPNRIQLQKNKDARNIKTKVDHQSKILIGWLKRAEEQLFYVGDFKNSLQQISEDSTVTKKSNGLSRSEKETYVEEKLNEEGGKKVAVKRKHDDSLMESLNISPSIGPAMPPKKKLDKDNEKKVAVKRKHDDSPVKSVTSSPVIGPVMPPGFCQSNNDVADESEDDDDDQFMPPPRKVNFTEKTHKSEKKSEPKSNEHERTVYVSNLHPATSESDLKIIFGRAGSVEKIDLHKQRGGKIFAFVTYSKPEEAHVAFELEHTPLRNRPVYVSKFNRSRDKQHMAPSYSQSQEKNKLFVSNLDKSTMPNDLEKLFNRHGDMISLRLINKKGSPKPFAYVEYKSEDIAAKYRSEINNTIVKGRQIVVEFSNPGIANQTDRPRFSSFAGSISTRPKAEDRKASETVVKDTETSDAEQTVRTTDDNVNEVVKKTSNTHFGFIPSQARHPRNQQTVARKPKGPAVRIEVIPPVSSTKSNKDSSSVPTDPVSTDEIASLASKSNDDFRKMLMKK